MVGDRNMGIRPMTFMMKMKRKMTRTPYITIQQEGRMHLHSLLFVGAVPKVFTDGLC